MKVDSKAKKEKISITIEGRVDMDTAPELERYFRENAEGKQAVEIDMKKVAYISSAGLRAFLWLKKQQSDDGYIVIKNMNDTVRSVFELTGFSDMFVIK